MECLVGQLNWVSAQMYPDVGFDMCELSGATRVEQVEYIRKANKVVKKIQERTISLKYFSLGNIKELVIECFSDAVFGNLEGGGSQGGYIIFHE